MSTLRCAYVVKTPPVSHSVHFRPTCKLRSAHSPVNRFNGNTAASYHRAIYYFHVIRCQSVKPWTWRKCCRPFFTPHILEPRERCSIQLSNFSCHLLVLKLRSRAGQVTRQTFSTLDLNFLSKSSMKCLKQKKCGTSVVVVRIFYKSLFPI